MKVALWILVFMVICALIGMLEFHFVTRRSKKIKDTNETPNIPSKAKVKDEEYVKYIMSSNPKVTQEDVIAFLSVLDIYDTMGNKGKTLESFDSFINHLATANPMHAMMVNGFFCGLLGSNMSLSKAEIDSLAKKNTPLIISKLNSQQK